MQVTVEDLSPVKKKLLIEIPEEDVTRELDNAYNKLKKTAKIKGFRSGKAPRSVLVRMFKKDVHGEVSSKLIQDSFVQAIKEHDLKILGNPDIEPADLAENRPYTYSVTVEIPPEIADIDFKGLKLKKNLYRVSDEEVDVQLKMLQKNLTTHKPLEEQRPVKDEDLVLIDYEGFRDGKPVAEIGKSENFSLKIGKGAILKEFDEQIIGMQPGENKTVTVSFPQDHADRKLAGRKIDFQVTLREIRQEVLPAIDDVFAKKVGKYENLDTLKEEIVKNLRQGYDKRVEQELNEQIFTQLIDRTNFEVPDTMIDYELDGIIDETERAFAYHNLSMEQMGHTREKLAEKYRPTAEKQVRRHLILSRIVEQDNLTCADEELENGFKEMAATYNQPLAEIKKYYDQNEDKLEFFKHTLLEKKAMKLIFENSIVEDVNPEDKEKAKTTEQDPS